MSSKKADQKLQSKDSEAPRIIFTALGQFKELPKHRWKQKDRTDLTRPEQAMSIRHILKRHRQGLQDNVVNEGNYPINHSKDDPNFDVVDLEKIPSLDMTQRQQLKEQFDQERSELEAKIKTIKDNQSLKASEKQKQIDQALAYYKTQQEEGAKDKKKSKDD